MGEIGRRSKLQNCSLMLQLGCPQWVQKTAKIVPVWYTLGAENSAKKECKLTKFRQLIIQKLRLVFARMTGLSFQSILCVRSHSVFQYRSTGRAFFSNIRI